MRLRMQLHRQQEITAVCGIAPSTPPARSTRSPAARCAAQLLRPQPAPSAAAPPRPRAGGGRQAVLSGERPLHPAGLPVPLPGGRLQRAVSFFCNAGTTPGGAAAAAAAAAAASPAAGAQCGSRAAPAQWTEQWFPRNSLPAPSLQHNLWAALPHQSPEHRMNGQSSFAATNIASLAGGT